MQNSGARLPISKNARLQGRAREVGDGEVGRVVGRRGAGGVEAGFGTLVRVVVGWGGEERKMLRGSWPRVHHRENLDGRCRT